MPLLIERELYFVVHAARQVGKTRVIEPILAGELPADDPLDDDVRFVQDLGLVTEEQGSLQIANPIYREVMPRALTHVMERLMPMPPVRGIDAAGQMDAGELLGAFRAWWLEHAEAMPARAPYSEAAAQLVFMAFLHRVVNGGGSLEREYAVGSGRIDLCLHWPVAGRGPQRLAFELEVWRDRKADPLEAGLTQIGRYLERLGLDAGSLLLFDLRSNAPPLPERVRESMVERGGRRIRVLRL